MRKSTRRVILFLALFAAILAGYFIFKLVLSYHVYVPEGFAEARTRGAIIAQDIVNESNSLDEQIAHINDLEKQKKYAEALKSIDEARVTVQDVRSKALELSKEMEDMTGALPAINSDAARQAALDSISNRLTLISRLITYTDDVNNLLSALDAHFRRGINNTKTINDMVNEVNAEVKAINAFNSQAGQAMDRFDRIVH